MKKPLTALSATIVLGIGAFSSVPTYTYAETSNSIQSKIIQNQTEKAKIDEQIARLEQTIAENQKVMEETTEKIAATQAKIDQLQAEKAAIQEQMAKREEQIKNRLRVMQAGGGPLGYLEVLLGATDFEDFISRASAISTLTKADQDLIAKQEEDKKAIEETEKAAQDELNKLNDMKVELAGMQSQIAEQKSQAESIKQQLATEGEQLLAQKLAAEQAAQQAALQAAVAASTNNTSNKTAVAKGNKPSSSSFVPTVSGGNAINTVISAGKQFLGNSSYGFGKADPVNGVFDCSGFVNWAFAQAGISVGRSTGVLVGQGTKVAPSDMRPGDLVFFNTDGRTNGHVGIYLGNGHFIGSQSSTGVAIANMSSGYWANAFNGNVRRIIN
ncbi:NlpC/P60 family protein [Caldibacillus thermoamylovorans]|uniref:C40 family peptidase n=1 Tax=Caldibacillus thermoamylovorans TaxID=35841 RepID=UPI001D065592|nr:C40 family peptidase [Caldibacillus thermoamylovorans]MCB5934993.1 NlpC/P60 family protein [Bacillus sp. DFI.2.34]MCB7076494.1 NlpC/P60 family protein [Caldibacillus thermoamylovorans]